MKKLYVVLVSLLVFAQLLSGMPVSAGENNKLVNSSDGSVPVSAELLEQQKKNAEMPDVSNKLPSVIPEQTVIPPTPPLVKEPTFVDSIAVPTGKDYYMINTTYLTTANYGDKYVYAFGLASASAGYVLSTRRNNVRGWTFGFGWENGWATTGTSFAVSGSGSHYAYITFNGWAGVNLLGGVGGNAAWSVVAEVWDITGSPTLIGSSTIFQAQSTNNVLVVDGGSYNNSILVSLQANHTYRVRLLTNGSASQYMWQTSIMESGTSSLYSTWNYIAIDWQ